MKKKKMQLPKPIGRRGVGGNRVKERDPGKNKNTNKHKEVYVCVGHFDLYLILGIFVLWYEGKQPKVEQKERSCSRNCCYQQLVLSERAHFFYSRWVYTKEGSTTHLSDKSTN